MNKAPVVSIIICTRNRAAALRETLAALARVHVPSDLPCELLVVDNGSTDDTARVVQECALPRMTVRYLTEARPGQSRARNAGMQAARGTFFLWTDDDVRPPADWIETMIAPLLSGAAGVAGGIQMAPHLRRDWIRPLHCGLLASTEHFVPERTRAMIGANMAFSRSVLEHVPAFDAELGPGALGFQDDSLFSFQMREAGLPIVPRLDANVEHHFDLSRLSRAAFLSRMRGEGRGQAYLAWHWFHGTFEHNPDALPANTLRRPALALLHSRLRLGRARLRRGLLSRPSATTEGAAEWEMFGVYRVAFYRQYAIECRRPRNYDKRGLVKLRGVLDERR